MDEDTNATVDTVGEESDVDGGELEGVEEEEGAGKEGGGEVTVTAG